MVRFSFTWLLLLLTSVLLAACCGSVACDCQDGFANAVVFRFNPDSLATQAPRGFTSAQVDTVLLVRYPLDTVQRPRVDSVLLTRPRRRALTDSILLNTTQPFAGARPLNQFRYELYLGRNRRRPLAYTIDSLRLEGRFEADGCCTCFLNTRKELWRNGAVQVLTDQSGRNRAGQVLISR